MAGVSVSPAGWYPDPSGRHLYRWWDGDVWTDRVGDGSVEQHDPIAPTPEPHAAPAVPAATWGTSAPAPAPSRSGCLIAAIVTGVLVIVVGIVAVVGFVVLAGSSKTILDENFDQGTGPFRTDSDNFVALELAHGGYQVTMKDASSPQEARSFFDPARDAVQVESDVSIVDAPAGASAGISCYSSPANGYLFAATNDGRWAIVKVIDADSGRSQVLREGVVAVTLGSTAHRLRLDCTGGGTGATTLSASIDGTPVATAADDQGYDQFRAAGYWVTAEKAPTVVLFDNLRVTVP